MLCDIIRKRFLLLPVSLVSLSCLLFSCTVQLNVNLTTHTWSKYMNFHISENTHKISSVCMKDWCQKFTLDAHMCSVHARHYSAAMCIMICTNSTNIFHQVTRQKIMLCVLLESIDLMLLTPTRWTYKALGGLGNYSGIANWMGAWNR